MARKETVVVDPEKIEWQSVVGGRQLPKGSWAKVLQFDEKTGDIVGLVKMDKGLHEPKHKHPSDEDRLVLEGKLVDDKGNEIRKGMYWFTPAGVEHAVDAPESCVLFVHFYGPPW